jgi:hypothetical protein
MEFKDYARFLRLLRDHPAGPFSPQIPLLGFGSVWGETLHKMDVAYRTVWRRWIWGRPRSTIDGRQRELEKLVAGSLQSRQRWTTEFEKFADETDGKFTGASEHCQHIAARGRKLDPAFFLSSVSDMLAVYRGKLALSPPPSCAGNMRSEAQDGSGAESE